MVRVRAMRTLENAMRRWGFYRVAGCDEVGRGCLAGPVVAGAVILDPGPPHSRASATRRRSPPLERERLYDADHAQGAGLVGGVRRSPTEIDEINIHRASLEAMRRAVLALAPLPDMVLVDAFRIPDLLDGAARRAARRPPVRRDRRRVDRRQGDARSRDAGAARAATRATATIVTRATPPPSIWPPSRGTATRRCTAARSSRRAACLIRSSSHSLRNTTVRVPIRVGLRGRASCRLIARQRFKQAEKLLRQGRLDGAIAEYVRLVEDQPRDWNAINALGDLYVRAGDADRAVAQFTRIADHLFAEGFFPKAAALYKKALKSQADHEHTLLRLAEIAAAQGLLADARAYLRKLWELRSERGDDRGAAECLVRLASCRKRMPRRSLTARAGRQSARRHGRRRPRCFAPAPTNCKRPGVVRRRWTR